MRRLILTLCEWRATVSSVADGAPFPKGWRLICPSPLADPDLIMCRKLAGISVGRLCEKCDGKCVICDSYVRPHTLVRVCDECNYGAGQGRCTVCGAPGISDAFYCKECVQQEKDVSAPPELHQETLASLSPSPPQRDGCPKVVNLGASKTDRYYESKKHGGMKTR